MPTSGERRCGVLSNYFDLLLLLAAILLARSALFDTRKRCSAASAASSASVSSAWGLSIFLLCGAIRESRHYPLLDLFE